MNTQYNNKLFTRARENKLDTRARKILHAIVVILTLIKYLANIGDLTLQ